MKSHDLDFDYLFLLEALESGVVPAEEHVETLAGMGLVDRTPDGGLALTMEAQVKLAQSPLPVAGAPHAVRLKPSRRLSATAAYRRSRMASGVALFEE